MAHRFVTLNSQDAWRVRGWSLAGALLIFTVMWLGFIWPSIFTLVALVIAPALVLFLIGTFWPPFYGEKKGVRLYLRASLILAGASWLFEIIWLTFPLG